MVIHTVLIQDVTPEVGWIATHLIDFNSREVNETLVEATAAQAEQLSQIEGIISVIAAQPGPFADDTFGAFILEPDGTGHWAREATV